MSSLGQLPWELLPLIISSLPKRSHIATTCLVSRSFYISAVPILYRQIVFYAWHKRSKDKIIHLFSTLANNPTLARHVLRIELRDFPKAQMGSSAKYDDLLDLTVKGLLNCHHLRSCTWTRDGSLNSSILAALSSLPELRELEINGHDHGNYDPDILPRFTSLERVSLIMPSGGIIARVPRWFQATGPTLRRLTIICKASTVVSDGVLALLAPNLVNLEDLNLTGCVKATEQGVLEVLRRNLTGIAGLSLEGLSPHFNMEVFARTCTSEGLMQRLRSITLTLDPTRNRWAEEVQELLSSSKKLEYFQVYSSTPVVNPYQVNRLWLAILAAHGNTLLRFSVHRIVMTLETIQLICARCPRLEELFIVIHPKALDHIGPYLQHASALRSLHINYPIDIEHDDDDDNDNDQGHLPVIPPAEALQIVEHCASSLQLIGVNTRVWQVQRHVSDEDVSRSLSAYEGNTIPEAFLVVRT